MQRVNSNETATIQPFFEAAAGVASMATCQRAKCGTVIIKDGEVIGSGFNGPALGDEANRTCDIELDTSKRPKYEKTCCIHAEWRAVLDACKTNADKIGGSVLYFMRIDDEGNFTDAGEPYCTTCSRITLESGVAKFALWNNAGADIYDAAEYNKKSYEYFT